MASSAWSSGLAEAVSTKRKAPGSSSARLLLCESCVTRVLLRLSRYAAFSWMPLQGSASAASSLVLLRSVPMLLRRMHVHDWVVLCYITVAPAAPAAAAYLCTL